MRARGRDREEDSSGEGESKEHNKHSALQTIAKAHDNWAHARLCYVDELLSSKIGDFRKIEPQRNSVETQAKCKDALQSTFLGILWGQCQPRHHKHNGTKNEMGNMSRAYWEHAGKLQVPVTLNRKQGDA